MVPSRALLRSVLVGAVVGTVGLSVAWAGVGVLPTPVAQSDAGGQGNDQGRGKPTPSPTATPSPTPSPTATSLPGATYLVGAAKTSILPRPQDMQARFPGARWETDPAECTTLDQNEINRIAGGNVMEPLDGIASAGSPWPENPNCIYMGGFGIGPMNPVQSFDPVDGLWVRSLAISDGSQTFITTVVDAEGWLYDYKSKCTDCGAKQIAEALAADPELKARGVTVASHVLHATHSHSAPDFIGGWGFVPNWYMAQVTDTIKATAKRAVMSMQNAKLEVGEIEAREFNSERRDTYRAAEEQQLGWLRAVGANGTIATLGAYAAHPTTRGTNNRVASGDWVALFERRLEERFGGIGLHVMTGLGNMSSSGGTVIGTKLADLIPEIGKGRPVMGGDLRLDQQFFTSAITNVPLDALGTPGFFDRRFDASPAVVNVGETETAPCTSASPQSVVLPVTVAKLGADLVFTTAPGEVFSNATNTIKEKSTSTIVLPFAQTNDSLGYMPQSFEINPVGEQGLGFAFGGYLFVNYEDSYAIDKCVGDGILEKTLAMMSALP